MTSEFARALAATSLSLALATTGAAVVTVSTADMAFAKSEKANSGNRGGNGNGNAGSNRGGGASEAGGDNRSSRGNGGASGDARATGSERSGARGDNGSGGERSDARGGNGNGGERSGARGSNGNGKIFGFLPAHRPSNAATEEAEPERTERTARSAPQASVRPAPRSDEEEEIAGNGWKARLDDGVLDTHPSELGMWNSARRSPQAIANMVAKYAETGDASGAGGAIGYLVHSHQQAAEGSTAWYDALQAAITDGDLTVEEAERLLDGTLSQDAFDEALAELGDTVIFEEGVISCAEDAECDPEQLAALQADADTLAFLDSEEAADLRDAQEGYDAALADVAAAEALVQPNKSTDEEVREQMLADVKDLLDIEDLLAPEFVAPETIEEDTIVEDTGETEEDA
jgi:hypothetical protein